MKLNKKQTEEVQEAILLCSKILLTAMELNKIDNFIESTIRDAKSGDRYKIKFEKV